MPEVPRTSLRLLVADGRTLLRDAMSALIVHQLGHELVASLGDGLALPARAEQSRAELALIELGLPPHGGLGAARALRARLPAVGVVLFGAAMTRAAIADGLHLGARAIVSVEATHLELGEALTSAAQGRRYLCHRVAAVLADALGEGGEPADGGVLERLSEREREVLSLLVAGRTSLECAAVMGLSVHTVETHRRHIMAKCEVHNVVDLVRLALEHGFGTAPRG